MQPAGLSGSDLSEPPTIVPPPIARTSSRREWLFCLLLLVVTVLAYQPVWHAGFIWDDDDYVTKNQTLRSLTGLGQIWFQFDATPQYYPLVHTSFWLEYHLWALNPLGYHLVNVLLQALAAMLLWRVLVKLQLPGAGLAAAFFAVHPVGVESVAWITERKNVLSAGFYLAAALTYLRFERLRDSGSSRRQPANWFWYATALTLFVGALFSKTVTCSLPAALLLVRWWKKGRITPSDGWLLLPFFAMGIGSGLLTAHLEKNLVGAQGTDWSLSFLQRGLIAGRALWFYAGKLVWPTNLTFLYPRWEITPAVWWQWLFPTFAIGVIAILWWMRHWLGRGPLVAVLFFAGTLFPALGFVNVFPMRFSFVADHFQYLASIGLLTLGAAGIAGGFGHFEKKWRILKPAFGGALLLLLGGLTWRQCQTYADIETLWRTTIARNPNSWLATYNLGTVLAQKNEYAEAIANFQKAVTIKPDFAIAHYNLGCVLLHQNRVDEAITHFQTALKFEPNQAIAHYELANALVKKGMTDEAITHLKRAVELNPNYAEAHRFLGVILLYSKSQPDEAMPHFRAALEINPAYAEANNYLGIALLQKGREREAAANFQMAIEIQPDYTLAENNLAWLLATSPDAAIRNGVKAIELAQKADQHSGGENPMVSMTLAAAYAEAGQFPEAITAVQRALKLASAQNNPGLTSTLQMQLELYQASTPFHLPIRTDAPNKP